MLADEQGIDNKEQGTKNQEPLSSDTVLSVRNVSKKFCRNLRRSMAYGIKDLCRNLVGMRSASGELRKDEFWALKDVSFDLKRGECLGVIGQNGCGKTTLLRLLAGIFPPDEGEISIRGRISALIALGAGFHPHMTGRENIYLNGTILGMSHQEINEKFDEIVKFSDIGAFLDAPVSTYSSGMRVRLGFSVAVNIDPEILIIDEVLAVGDLAFQRKSFQKILQFCGKGKLVIFVSHNVRSIQDLCTKVLLLDHGAVSSHGDSNEVVGSYIDSSRKETGNARMKGVSGAGLSDVAVGDVKVEQVRVINAKGDVAGSLRMGEDVIVEVAYSSSSSSSPDVTADFQVSLFTGDNVAVQCFNTKFSGVVLQVRKAGVVRLLLPGHPLMPGKYVLRGAVLDRNSGVPYDTWGVLDDRYVEFEVLAGKLSGSNIVAWDNLGVVNITHVWSADKDQ